MNKGFIDYVIQRPDLEKKGGLRLAVGILVRHQGEGHDWRQKRASDERHLLAAPG